MNPSLVAAQRRFEVRKQAALWVGAGVIGPETQLAIENEFPDDRRRLGPGFRLLVLFFSFFGGLMLFLLFADLTDSAFLAIPFSVAFWILTELQVIHFKRVQGGSEEATSALAIIMALVGVFWLLDKQSTSDWSILIFVFFICSCVLCAVAVWRWGMPLYGFFAAIALFLTFAQLGAGRVLWIVMPILLAPWLLRWGHNKTVAPSHRNACQWALAVVLAAIYVAVNPVSLQHRWIENLAPWRVDEFWASPSSIPTWLAFLFSSILALAVLTLGLRRKDKLLLLCGALMTIATLATIRYYIHVAPLWVVLTASGAFCIALALGVRHYLDSDVNKERWGFTAEPLFTRGQRERLLEIATTIATLSPEAQAPQDRAKFEAGGGSFGGGGASESF